MDTRLKYRYVIVRFVPNQLRGEFINIGIILHVMDTGQLFSDWLKELGRMRCLSKDITSEDYINFRKYLAENFIPGTSFSTLDSPETIIGEPVSTASSEFLDYLYKEVTGQFQFSEPVSGFTNNPKKQLERLFDMFVKPLSEEGNTQYPHLAKIRQKIDKIFSRANLIGPEKLTPKLPVQGRSRDWSFDYGYANGRLKLFEIISMAQKDPEFKSDRALVFNGKINDVRQRGEFIAPTVEAYAIIHQSSDPARIEGVEEAKRLLKNNEVIPVVENDISDLVKDLQQSLNVKTFYIKSLN